MINECPKCRCQLPAIAFGFVPQYCPQCGSQVNAKCPACENYHPAGATFCAVYGIEIKRFSETKEALEMAARNYGIQNKDLIAGKLKRIRSFGLFIFVLLPAWLLLFPNFKDGIIFGTLLFFLWLLFFVVAPYMERGNMMGVLWVSRRLPDCIYFVYEKKGYRAVVDRRKLAEHMQKSK